MSVLESHVLACVVIARRMCTLSSHDYSILHRCAKRRQKGFLISRSAPLGNAGPEA